VLGRALEGFAVDIGGQQCFDVFHRGGLRQFGEDFAQVRVRLQAIGTSRFNQRVQIGTRLGTGDALMEEPVSASDTKGSDGIFDGVRVDVVTPIVAVTNESMPVIF
jgi:hypothetical protein